MELRLVVSPLIQALRRLKKDPKFQDNLSHIEV